MFLSGTVPARPVAAYRIVLGVIALARCADEIPILARLYDPAVYRIAWVPWMPAVPPSAAFTLLAVWAVAALAFLAGWHTRTAGTTAGLAMATVLLLDAQTYTNNLYLLSILVPLVGLAGGGRALSLDARRRGHAATVPAWPVRLVQTQITVVYLFSAISKITPDYLRGEVIKYSLPRDLLLALPHTAFVWTVVGAAVLVIMSELFIAVGLWVPRYRAPAMGLAVLIHAGMIVLLGGVRLQIALFAAMMLGSFGLWGVPSLVLRRAVTSAQPPRVPSPADR